MTIISHYLPTDHRHQLGTMDVALLLQVANQHGIDTTQLLTTMPYSLAELASGQVQMTYADKLVLFRAVNQVFQGQGLGLLCGAQARLSHFGILGYAVLSSATIEQALRTGLKYLNLNGPLFSVTLIEQQGRASIVMENVLDIGELLPFCSEYFLSALLALFDELTGKPLSDARLTFPYAAPYYVADYQRRFGGNLEFDHTHLSLSFDAQQLALPVKTHNVNQLKQYLHSCAAVCEALASPHRLPNQIKAMLYQSSGQFPSLSNMAAQYGCSERTLRRRLTEHNTCYQTLLSEARVVLAKEYLLGTQLTVEEIGFRLGYSDAANFRRGFKRLTGQTPQQFRGEKLKKLAR